MDLGELQEFVGARAVKTSFHFPALMAMAAPSTGVVCNLCYGWRRRIQERRAGGQLAKRQLTPLDAVISVVLTPGATPALDQRNWHGLLVGVGAPGNLFADVIPLPVRSIIAAATKAAPHEDHRAVLARAWYDYNARPVFFSSAKVGQTMRRFVDKN